MASVYSPEQISAFLRHIRIPEDYYPENKPAYNAAFLNALHVCTISTIPYENLNLHYSPTRQISIDPHHSFQKILGDGRGRGGYCMEVSILFNHVLRGLGFKAYTAGVRIRMRQNGVPSGDFIGWVHLVNVVTLPTGDKYVLDVGFGGDGATKPMPLIAGNVVENIGTQEIRFVHDFIPQQTDRSEHTKLWIYQYRNAQGKEWNSFYAFPELEFLQADFRIMNWFTGSSPESHQTYSVLVIKFLRRKKEGGNGVEEEIYGKRMLVNGTVKENLGGRTQVVQECKSEAERIEALGRWFDIQLTEEEKCSIVGHCSELRDSTP